MRDKFILCLMGLSLMSSAFSASSGQIAREIVQFATNARKIPTKTMETIAADTNPILKVIREPYHGIAVRDQRFFSIASNATYGSIFLSAKPKRTVLFFIKKIPKNKEAEMNAAWPLDSQERINISSEASHVLQKNGVDAHHWTGGLKGLHVYYRTLRGQNYTVGELHLDNDYLDIAALEELIDHYKNAR